MLAASLCIAAPPAAIRQCVLEVSEDKPAGESSWRRSVVSQAGLTVWRGLAKQRRLAVDEYRLEQEQCTQLLRHKCLQARNLHSVPDEKTVDLLNVTGISDREEPARLTTKRY